MPRKPTGRPPGRPPHPGLLTPAEQRVLEMLRLRLTNAEIAVRLGISPDGVKYHVSNMLSKLHLERREQLAAWTPAAERGLFRRVWSGAMSTMGAAGGALAGASAWRIAAAVSATAGLAGLAAVVVIVLSMNNDSEKGSAAPSSTSTTTATTSATATATASPTQPVATPTRVAIPPPVASELPQTLALYLVPTCAGCGWAGERLDRVYRDQAGAMHRETLYEAPGGSRNFLGAASRVSSPVSMTDQFAVGVCVRGDCWSSLDSESAWLRSSDGGVTWTEAGRLQGPGWTMFGITADHIYARRTGFDGNGDRRIAELPSGKLLDPPADSADLPQVFVIGNVVGWLARNQKHIIHSNGDYYFDAPFEGVLTKFFAWGRIGVVMVSHDTHGNKGRVDTFHEGGGLKPWFDVTDLDITGWVARSSSFYGISGSKTNVGPAILSLDTNSAITINGFFAGDTTQVPVGATSGSSFVRVNTPGDCLNVRKEATTASESLGCYRDGVLFALATPGSDASGLPTAVAGAEGWVWVLTPDGQTGFAASQFLLH